MKSKSPSSATKEKVNFSTQASPKTTKKSKQTIQQDYTEGFTGYETTQNIYEKQFKKAKDYFYDERKKWIENPEEFSAGKLKSTLGWGQRIWSYFWLSAQNLTQYMLISYEIIHLKGKKNQLFQKLGKDLYLYHQKHKALEKIWEPTQDLNAIQSINTLIEEKTQLLNTLQSQLKNWSFKTH